MASPAPAGGFLLNAAEMDRVTAGFTIGDANAFASATGADSLTQTFTDTDVERTAAHAYSEAVGAGPEGSVVDSFATVEGGGSELTQSVDAVSVAISEGATLSGTVADAGLTTDGQTGTLNGVAVSNGEFGSTEATASFSKVTESGESAAIAAGDAFGSTGGETFSTVFGSVSSQLDMKIGATASGDDVSNAGSALEGDIAMNGLTFSPSAGSSLSSTGDGSWASSTSFLRTIDRGGVTAMFVGSVAGGSGDSIEKVAESSIAISGEGSDARIISKTIESDRGNGTRSVTFAIVLPEAALGTFNANQGLSRLRSSTGG